MFMQILMGCVALSVAALVLFVLCFAIAGAGFLLGRRDVRREREAMRALGVRAASYRTLVGNRLVTLHGAECVACGARVSHLVEPGKPVPFAACAACAERPPAQEAPAAAKSAAGLRAVAAGQGA